MFEKFISSYKKSIKSNHSDELVNIYFIRPVAHIFTYPLSKTAIRPEWIVLLNSLFGITSSILIIIGQLSYASIFLMLKNIFDAVDGQLARLTNSTSRIGRFLDSISDFFVNLLIFLAIFISMIHNDYDKYLLILPILALIGITLRVSFFVYFQVRYLHSSNSYKLNKLVESIDENKNEKNTFLHLLKRLYILIYGWQDNLIYRFDRYITRMFNLNRSDKIKYYSHSRLLRLNGFLGLGTETTILSVFIFFDLLVEYVILNTVLLNMYLLCIIFYRIFILNKLNSD